MVLKFKNVFKSLDRAQRIMEGAFRRLICRSYSLQYLHINLLGVNGVGTAVAKEKTILLIRERRIFRRMTHISKI